MPNNNNHKGKPAPHKPAAVTMAKGGEKTVSAPAVISKVMQTDFEIFKGPIRGAIRIHGSDWLGRLPIPASPTAGQAIGEFYINPLEYPGTRLALFAQLYDKFRFKRLRFKFVPYQGTAVPGAVIMAYDRDISDPTPPANDSGVRQYMAMMDACAGPIWQPLTMDCSLSHPESGLFTNAVPGGDDRLAYQGQVYVALLEPPAAGVVLAGDLFVEYDLELFDPQLETNVAIGSSAVQGANTVNVNAGDLLLSFINGTGNAARTTTYVPKLDGLGKAYLDLAQGVYRITSQLSQSKAGAVNLGAVSAAQVVPNTPKAAPAPQPQIAGYQSINTSAVGSVASKSSLYAVPPGGAKFYSVASDLTGIDATLVGNYQGLTIDKLADAWTDLTNFV